MLAPLWFVLEIHAKLANSSKQNISLYGKLREHCLKNAEGFS